MSRQSKGSMHMYAGQGVEKKWDAFSRRGISVHRPVPLQIDSIDGLAVLTLRERSRIVWLDCADGCHA
eukprot:scaffold606349_cov22-Prasinocladus_malaysianus.AAC.1